MNRAVTGRAFGDLSVHVFLVIVVGYLMSAPRSMPNMAGANSGRSLMVRL
ncbi:protein of unknown function [Pseudodesulfovibrio piezophilus C1TLV30]|uniref:Uncharacterized protein n=1 Tax=Pseudodesulfovibrio piezophilus (strain DSM 21447 / JCM 15486 / C1TLV30) TaxID=1322246 RepID=M1WX25_PSEP2|nr:protein of unknown function [Pseudodesulfovibrio piezophilus C1TLV30]